MLTFALRFGRAWRPSSVFRLGEQEGRLHARQPGRGVGLAACRTAGGDREKGFIQSVRWVQLRYVVNLSAGDSPLFSVIIQFLTDEGLSRKAKLLQHTNTAVRWLTAGPVTDQVNICRVKLRPLTSLSVLLFSLMTLIQSSMSSRSSACSRYSQKSWVVSRRACFRLVSLYAMSTRQPRMLIGCSSSAAPPIVAPRSTASLLSL